MGDQDLCKGCGLAIEPHYWINTPHFCHRCSTTLFHLARRWRELVNEPRTLTHITFARDYTKRYAHGAPGHLDLITIGLLADILDDPGKVLQ